jgi:hypothetical protein
MTNNLTQLPDGGEYIRGAFFVDAYLRVMNSKTYLI